MTLTRRSLIAASVGTTMMPALPRLSRAQAANTIRIGVLNDQSGPYRDLSGPYGVQCTLQAVQEFGNRGFNVEVINADHQNKPDVGVNIARQWYDQGVDMIIDVPTSSVGLAVNNVAREKNKAYVNTGSATSDLTGTQCSPNTVHWTYDTYMLAKSTGAAIVKTGGDSWYFITADYAFGHALERDTGNFVRAQGGRVLGAARYPFPATTDFSAFLLQAQASRAKVLGMANASTDTVNTIKAAREFGLHRTMKLAALLMGVVDVKSLGLESGQGLLLTESFYWDLNPRTRALTERVRAKNENRPPAMVPAGCYGAVLHYLKAVAEMGVAQAKASGVDAVARMKALPCDDDAFGPGTIRADGRKLHPAFLFEVKAPAESRNPWDLYKLAATTPGEEVFRPLADGNCPLVRS
jgi:branched-chain amino acid transport system substrate-binding protein